MPPIAGRSGKSKEESRRMRKCRRTVGKTPRRPQPFPCLSFPPWLRCVGGDKPHAEKEKGEKRKKKKKKTKTTKL